MANSTSGDSTLDRLVRVLSAFDARVPSMTVSTLAAAANIPLATAYRLVDQLVGHDFLRKDTDGKVCLGMGLWEIVSRSSSAPDLREAARPFMDDIQTVIGQHTQLAVLRDDEVLFIERLSGRDAVVNRARIAGRLPVHRTSVGMVLLAFSPSHVQEAYFRAHPDAALPQHVGGGDLRAVLAQTRQQGYIALGGLMDQETTGIAVPVLGRGNMSIAALGVVVARHEEGSVHAFLPVLMTGARGIARAIGMSPG